ncbi:MAG: glycosyltransferase family 39 protein [Elusimicrobiota bacterium]
MTERRALIIILAAAFFVRVLYCWGFGPYEPGGDIPSYDHYQNLAHSLYTTGSLRLDGDLSAFREPAYPMFLAALYRVAGESFPVLWIAQSLVDVLTVWLVFLLGRRIFSRNVAWAAAVFAAFYPQMIYYAAEPRRESFLVCALALAMWATITAGEKPKDARFLVAGLLWAVPPLTKSVYLPVGVLAAVVVWLLGRRREQDLRRGAAVFLAAFLGVYALWPLRNYLVFGQFIPGITGGGGHLYVGLIVPDKDAGTSAEEKYILNAEGMKSAARLGREGKLNVAEHNENLDRHFYRESAHWIMKNPGRFTLRLILSALKLWRLYPYERDYGRNYRLLKWVSLLSDGWLIPLALAGMLLAGRKFPPADLFLVTLLAATFVYMIFWAVIRYRLPLMPYIFLYAAYALERAVLRVRPGALPFPASKEAA